MAELIKKMLEDSDSCDRDIDYLIWCFINKLEPVRPAAAYGFVGDFYTTSLDAAMSIGAEELEGWKLTVTFSGPNNDTWNCALWNEKTDTVLVGNGLATMPRAICHARIQVLEWKRGNDVL